MATWFNKWLVMLVFPLMSFTRIADAYHPLHVSVLELNHNAQDKTLEISCRIFTDDFEKVLAQNYKTKIDLINPHDRAAMEKLVNDYVTKRIKIEADGKPVTWVFLGYEKDNDAIYSYFQVDKVTTVKKINITNTVMQDMFDDQINLMHVTVGGTRKSTKLNYPDKEASFLF